MFSQWSLLTRGDEGENGGVGGDGGTPAVGGGTVRVQTSGGEDVDEVEVNMKTGWIDES